MGIRTVMITGDNPRTAATIAREAGVDDFIAEATPEDKIAFIRKEQADGHLVAMTGDGTNDAPAVAQADVGLAMNSGTSACKEAANMVDLDSDPTKLLEVIAIGKQLLITRGSITTFSIANDVAKYFAIIPALFVAIYPELDQLDVMSLSTAQSAILSAVIFNALIIPALIPLALRGVSFKPAPASELLRRNLLVYGLGGIIAPFVGIKLIDVVISALGPRIGHLHMDIVRRQLWPAVGLTLVLTLIVGILYPLAITVVAQVAFPSQANGSLITAADGRVVGSTPHRPGASASRSTSGAAPRRPGPTATTPTHRLAPTWAPRAPRSSNGSRRTWSACAPRTATRRCPVDLVTTSASGLDPHISPEAAEYQVERVAAARGMEPRRGARARGPAHGAAAARLPGPAARQRPGAQPRPRRAAA